MTPQHITEKQTGLAQQEFKQLQILQKYLEQEQFSGTRNTALDSGQSSNSPEKIQERAQAQRKPSKFDNHSSLKKVITPFTNGCENRPKTVERMLEERKQIKAIQSALAAENSKV